MNLEERVEFLHQSIESHDRQIGELTDGLAQYIAESREATKEMKLAIGRLATAMHGLNEQATDHHARIERLEGGRA